MTQHDDIHKRCLREVGPKRGIIADPHTRSLPHVSMHISRIESLSQFELKSVIS